MLESVAGRLAVAAVLGVVLLALASGYGTLSPDPDVGAYPSGTQLLASYESHLGEHVQVTGRVVDTDPLVIAPVEEYAGSDTEPPEFTVTGVSTVVTVGARLQVYGVARPDRTIAAENVLVVPLRNLRYMYLVSMLSGLWVLARVIRGWRFDRRTASFEQRDQPLGLPVRGDDGPYSDSGGE